MTEPDYGVILGDADREFRDQVRAFLASALTADVRGSGRDDTDRLDRMRLWQSRT